MHEYSLVRALLSQVREAAEPYRDAAVDQVVVAVGPLSGVEPLLLGSAFERLAAGTPFHAARLVVEQMPLHLTCRTCGKEYETESVEFACPSCSSVQTQVLAGDEVILRRLQLRELTLQEAAS